MIERVAFFAELKRRNVLRAAVLYVGAVWVLAQGISQLSPAVGLPDWSTRWFLIAALIGSPFWIAFAWFYEFTPQGIKRESDVAEDASSRHSAARKLDFAIIAVLTIAVALLGSGYFIQRKAPADAKPKKAAAFDPPEDTLVVLPFENLSGDPKQQYFSDGVTEELTGALGQNPALRVIAWDTASKYRGSSQSATDIGRALNVANVLHGSIAREGNEVRIATELVDARTGYELWSQHYDDSFANVFAVQDQVSQAIAQALRVKFAKADLPVGGTRNPEAHDLVLRGRALEEKQDVASLEAARADFEQALVLDPDYADAHALLARTLVSLTERSNLSLKQTLPRIRAEAEKALALDARNADAWLALGVVDANEDPPRISRAQDEYRKALALDPSNASAHLDYGLTLPLRAGLAEEQGAAQLDPDLATAQINLAYDYQDLGNWYGMIQAAQALIRLDPADVDSAFVLAYANQQLRRYDHMIAAFDRVKPGTAMDKEQVAAGRLVYQSLVNSAMRPRALVALKGLSRDASNPNVASNVLQLYLALDQNSEALRLLQNFCSAQPAGCGDLNVNSVYAPLRADPAFRALAKKYTASRGG